jgi:hypothetical protein
VEAELREWVHGSFDACIPICIGDSFRFSARKVFIRFPLPYKVGESQYLGSAEEKLRCEVATYIWIQSHFPDVPIPCLRGFGFPVGWSLCDYNSALLFPNSRTGANWAALSLQLTKMHPRLPESHGFSDGQHHFY